MVHEVSFCFPWTKVDVDQGLSSISNNVVKQIPYLTLY